MYQCPLCQTDLARQTHSWRCVNGHSFDIAREGYVNLLPVQQKKSLQPGDNAEMMQARRAFLQAGHYQPLSDAANALLAQHCHSSAALLDIGCGEGYYSARLAGAIASPVYGLDISKTAVRYAAKRYPHLHWCVASSYQLPFQTGQFGGLLRIYAPSQAEEMARVTQTGGWLLTVSPAPEHLLQFKQQAYQQVRLHSAEIKTEAGFRHHQRQRLQIAWQAPDTTAMQQLINMTPLAYKLNQTQRDSLLGALKPVQLDFYLDLYQRL